MATVRIVSPDGNISNFCTASMEAMDVDEEPQVVAVWPPHPDGGRWSQSAFSDSDDSEVGPNGEVPPFILTAWAFNQRSAHGPGHWGEPAPRAARGRPPATQPLRRSRRGLTVHYPSQNAVLDFLLRAPAASGALQESGSSTEVSSSDTEEEEERRPSLGPSLAGPHLGPSLGPSLAGPHLGPSLGPSLTGLPLGPSLGPSLTGPPPGTLAPPSAPMAPPSLQPSQSDEGDTCTICFEPWAAAGEHRLATLRCGHLFGHACIVRWLKGQGPAARCPQCNKKAKRSDIVLLYARKLSALDNSEQEGMKKSLAAEQSLRRKAELESAQCRTQLQVVTDECGKLRKQLQELRTLISQAGSTSSSVSSSTGGVGLPPRGEGSRGGAHYTFSKAVLVSQPGGCRVLAYCPPLSCLLASQPSPQATLVPGYGVKKVSTVTMKGSQYVPIHSKQIRGLAFNTRHDSLMLSAALDHTLKLTSLLTNTVVQTYNAGKPVWSCSWSLDNSNYVYAGLLNGSVLVYDTRDTSTHVQELLPLGARCPVASLCYVPRAASSSFPCGGILAGSLEGACLWEQVEGTYRPHPLPLEASGCIDIQVETDSRHCLVTYRPGRANPSLRCNLMELTRAPQLDQNPACSWAPVHTFTAGSSCKLLTKSAVFPSPAGGAVLVCVGDEASNSTMVWDAGTGALLQKLPADLPVLDICPLEVNGEHYLASLTEKMLKVYKWE
ncbi:unnamed protein product [Merluccius merluccius]